MCVGNVPIEEKSPSRQPVMAKESQKMSNPRKNFYFPKLGPKLVIGQAHTSRVVRQKSKTVSTTGWEASIHGAIPSDGIINILDGQSSTLDQVYGADREREA